MSISSDAPPEAAPQSQNPIIIRETAVNRSPIWILGSVTLGFLLPLCACGFLLFIGLIGTVAAGVAGTEDLGEGPAIAIVRVEGTIINTDDQNYINGAGSGTINDELRRAEANPDVKAIVLRVDSPGGTVTGSAQIYEVLRDEITKPVIVSMAGVAASGGYYVSAPADYIFARADTVTGSIGVILTLFNATELIDELGVDVISITTGPNKSIGSPWNELTDEQRAIFDESIQESYDDFVAIIVDGRSLSEAAVRELADGRTYSGRQALALGLVDELGNFQNAIAKAAELGGIEGEPRIIEYERIPEINDFLFGLQSRLNRSTADEIVQTVTELAAPALEYRYLGR